MADAPSAQSRIASAAAAGSAPQAPAPPRLPDTPLAPEVFFTRWLPEAFAARAGERGARSSEHSIGVRLEGEGGGAWVLRVVDGALVVRAGEDAEAALRIVQSTRDFRGALWEGRGLALAATAFAGAPDVSAGMPDVSAGMPDVPAGFAAAGALPGTALLQTDALAELARLDGLLRFRVTDGPGGDWCLDLRLGPGALPAAPDCEVSIAHAEAAQLAAGRADPFEFLFGGGVLIRGDMTLLLQLQAIQMEATSGRAAWGGSSIG